MIGAVLNAEVLTTPELTDRIERELHGGARLGLLTARSTASQTRLVALLIHPDRAGLELLESQVDGDSYPAITPRVPQAHWFERAIADFFGIHPDGHPRPKSLIIHDAWPNDLFPVAGYPITQTPKHPITRKPYRFMEVRGEGVYEIPVGPIHAGIIEPGHFRFSCLGEVIQNLEIRLGYQHRGIERRMTEIPWQHARHLAEAASSDTAAANALAHALAMESILGVEPTESAHSFRALALEIERVASHLGDLGGVCADIGYAGGASIFGCLRGNALGLAERLTGSRFQTSFIVPGGIAHHPSRDLIREIKSETADLIKAFKRAEPMLLDNAGALERMEGVGKVRPSLARDFGLVGPAGRASGLDYDVRIAFPVSPYRGLRPCAEATGDVLCRIKVRADETCASLEMIFDLLSAIDDQDRSRTELPSELPANRAAAGVVESWRGELIHLVFTDEAGHISRYCIKDPSFNNWTGLVIAARGELVADFPLCNKSFGLSYSGNDL